LAGNNLNGDASKLCNTSEVELDSFETDCTVTCPCCTRCTDLTHVPLPFYIIWK